MIKIRIMRGDGTKYHQRNDRVYDYDTDKELSDYKLSIIKAKNQIHESSIQKIMEAYQEYVLFGLEVKKYEE